MAIALPDWPAPAKMTPRLITSRAELRSAFAGSTQRFNRMGARYAIDVDMPPMRAVDANDWSDIDDEESTVTLPIVQPGLDSGAPGAPKVNGADQAGSSLILDGLTPHYVLRKNQWLSISTGSRLYAYRVKTEAVVAADGAVTVALRTMLRTPPADNDVVEIAAPRIEGFATVAEGAWSMGPDGLVYLSFTIEERG